METIEPTVVEKTVEVPVEVVKEVEKIVEVETIKEVENTDKIEQLEKQNAELVDALEQIQKQIDSAESKQAKDTADELKRKIGFWAMPLPTKTDGKDTNK